MNTGLIVSRSTGLCFSFIFFSRQFIIQYSLPTSPSGLDVALP
jgi:hypothetical protein